MSRPMTSNATRLLVLALASTILSACSGWDRLSQVGEAPKLTSIQNPTEVPGYRPVSLPTFRFRQQWRGADRGQYSTNHFNHCGRYRHTSRVHDHREPAILDREYWRPLHGQLDSAPRFLRLGRDRDLHRFQHRATDPTLLPRSTRGAAMIRVDRSGKGVGEQ